MNNLPITYVFFGQVYGEHKKTRKNLHIWKKSCTFAGWNVQRYEYSTEYNARQCENNARQCENNARIVHVNILSYVENTG